MKTKLLTTIEIPALTKNEINQIYEALNKKLELSHIDKRFEKECQTAQFRPHQEESRKPLTLYAYEFIVKESEGANRTFREYFQTLGETECSVEPYVPIYVLINHAEFLDGKRNTFFFWDEFEFKAHCLLLVWIEATKGYIDRHCGFPYLEFEGSPGGWSLGYSSMSKNDNTQGMIGYSTRLLEE